MTAGWTANAQESSQKGFVARVIVEDGDTVIYTTLPNIYVFPPFKFKSEHQEKKYRWLVNTVKRTLPFAKKIAVMLNDVNKQMETMSEKEKKKFMKETEKKILAEFKPQLMKLSVRQSKVLIRLVDRETDQTGYEIIKQLRGGFVAGFWQVFAKLVGTDLKADFDLEREDDRMLDRIVILVENGQL